MVNLLTGNGDVSQSNISNLHRQGHFISFQVLQTGASCRAEKKIIQVCDYRPAYIRRTLKHVVSPAINNNSELLEQLKTTSHIIAEYVYVIQSHRVA